MRIGARVQVWCDPFGRTQPEGIGVVVKLLHVERLAHRGDTLSWVALLLDGGDGSELHRWVGERDVISEGETDVPHSAPGSVGEVYCDGSELM